MKNFFPGLLTIVALFISSTIFAQVIGEYRSSQSGNWNDHNTWEQWDGSDWINTATFPQNVEGFPEVAGTNSSAETDETDSHEIALPSGIEAGDLLLIFWSDGQTSSDITTTGWTLLYENVLSNNRRRATYYRIADGSEGNSAIFNTSAEERSAHNSYRIAVGTYTGAPIAGIAETGTNGSPNPPNLDPGLGTQKFLWIAASHSAGNNPDYDITNPTDYDFQVKGHTGSQGAQHATMVTARRELEASSEDPETFSLGSNRRWAANTIAIQAAGAIATIHDGHVVTITDDVEMFDVEVEAGAELTIEENITLTIIEEGVLDNNAGGVISGTGTLDFSGDDFTNAGTISPGFSPGILNITGTFQNEGEIDIEITGAPAGGAGVAFDQLNISGKAIINGTINVDFGDYIPLPGYEYQIITGGEGYEGMPALNVVSDDITASYNAGILTILTSVPNNVEKVWDRGANTDNWEDPENWLPDGVPGPGDDIWIGYFPDVDATVVLSTETEIESMVLGSSLKDAHLTIADGASLTTNGQGEGGDGIHLWVNSSSALIVDGELNVEFEDLAGGDGIDINLGTSMIVGETGMVNIDVIGNDALEIAGQMRNSGLINIGAAAQWAINVQTSAPDSAIINYITGQVLSLDSNNPGINLASGGGLIRFINEGTVILTTNATNIVTGSGTFHNYGTFGGEGLYASAQNFVNFVGAVLSPGTSPGILTLNRTSGTLDLSNVTFNMEIEGNGAPGVDYDQVVVTAPTLDITDAILNLSGSYVPVPGDEFVLLTYSGDLNGRFAGMGEGEEFEFNGFPFVISYETPGEIIMMNMAVLPVELIGFNARPLGNEAQLTWTTASELNNDYFTIERSADGRNFEAIATVYGKGTTTEISNYLHVDKTPLRGLNYYRLKQTDFDGGFSYSDLKSVEFKTSNSVKVYPTLVENAVTIETNGSLSGKVLVIVRDFNGRDCKSFEFAEKSEKIELPLNDLIPGSYFIIIYHDNGLHTQKIIKP